MGVDPGAGGAVGYVADGTADALLVNTRDPRAFREALLSLVDSVEVAGVGIEKVSARPGQGVVSVFNFGVAYGVVLAAAEACGYIPVSVRPQTWYRLAFGKKKAPKEYRERKNAVRALAAKRWPMVDFSRVKDSGKADALFIALAVKDALENGRTDRPHVA